MSNTNYAIFYSSEDYDSVLKIKEACSQTKLNLCIETDFYIFLTKVVKLKPKFIFIDGLIKDLNMLPLDVLDNDVLKVSTKIAIINYKLNKEYIDDISINNLCGYILNSKVYYIKPSIKVDIDYINSLLLKLNFSSSHKGKDYIKECISLILEDKLSYNYLNTKCYPVIAGNFRTETINIDRDIRTAIKRAYENRNNEYWEELFNTSFDKMPTSKNFIYMCADKLKELFNGELCKI